MTKLILLLGTGSVITLSACTTTIPDPHPNIRMSTANTVVGCKHVGHVSANAATPYGLFSGRAEDALREGIKNEGYKLGATDIVLSPLVKTEDDISVNGQAYICP